MAFDGSFTNAYSFNINLQGHGQSYGPDNLDICIEDIANLPVESSHKENHPVTAKKPVTPSCLELGAPHVVSPPKLVAQSSSKSLEKPRIPLEDDLKDRVICPQGEEGS